jgi:hypothetical protein
MKHPRVARSALGALLLFLPISMFLCSGTAYPDTWARHYHGYSTHSFSHLDGSTQNTSDGGYIMAGTCYYTDPEGHYTWHIVVLKFDADGSLAWQRTYGGDRAERAKAIRQTSDGGYILQGETWSFAKDTSRGEADIWVLKLNADGTIAWQKTYGSDTDTWSSGDYAGGIAQTSDGGYIMAGVNGANSKLWVLKLTADGTISWQKRYTPDTGVYGKLATPDCIEQTSYGYILAAHAQFLQASDDTHYDAWVLSLDSGGDVRWQTVLGVEDRHDQIRAIHETADGGTILAGRTESSGAAGDDLWVVKLNGSTVDWQKTYGGAGDDSAESIHQTPDHGYIVAGNTRSFPSNRGSIWVLKLSEAGDATWQKSYGDMQDANAFSVEVVNDGYVVGGEWRQDPLLLKLDLNGDTTECIRVQTTDASSQDPAVPAFDLDYRTAETTISPLTSAAEPSSEPRNEADTCPRVTITSSPAGLNFSVTGAGCQPGAYITPTTMQWTPASSCTVACASPQSGGPGKQYVFAAWAGGVTDNPRVFTAPAVDLTYTANYLTQYELTTAVSPPDTGSVTGAGFHNANSAASIVATAGPGYQFVSWTGPVASPTSAATTVAMLGPRTVTANFALISTTTVSPASGQYSDPVTLTATIGPSAAVFSGSLQFKIDGVNAGAAIPVTGGGVYSTSYTIGNAAGAYTIEAVLTSTTPTALGSSGGNTLTVTKEDATVTSASTNPQSVKVNVAGGAAGPVVLTGTITQAADGSLGDIAKALVTVALVPMMGGGTINCPVTNAAGELTAACAVVPVDVYEVQWTVGGNYFAAPQENGVLAVYDPSLGFVTGGGTVRLGTVRAQFAVNVKYLKNGNIQGSLVYKEYRTTGTIVIKSTALTSLSIVGTTAVLQSKATVNGVGGYTIQAVVTDNGEPGIGYDLFGLQALPVVAFAPMPIAGGNIQVPHLAK